LNFQVWGVKQDLTISEGKKIVKANGGARPLSMPSDAPEEGDQIFPAESAIYPRHSGRGNSNNPSRENFSWDPAGSLLCHLAVTNFFN